MKIQKRIAHLGYCSRRQAEALILQNKVKVNSSFATIGQIVSDQDIIEINGKILVEKENEKEYYLLHKPPKTISSTKDEKNRQVVTDLVKSKSRVYPVGRLDYNTTGVLILTNDGDLTQKLLHPKYQIKRLYHCKLDIPLEEKELIYLNEEKIYIDKKLSIHKVLQVEKKSYLVELHQGSYHHVKKIFEKVNRKVVKLKRLAFGPITIDNLPEGYFRKLTFKEIKTLKALTRD
ncbi:RIBOSOMAL LARGE SUBUNIT PSEUDOURIDINE SYNTHASE B (PSEUDOURIDYLATE SYNTHASE) (URACIL HYDROLYASE) [Mycoplasmopsis pulmonis]|uniref:Pseudouridine synthase n=1 Tax=Mycoplasmopsis pulmonis (strain UAB CTIP) TaxID=272635 RepID=Q98QM4_MYCPU|nr:pseudouridine synthase [Mycoplasmopsis pulmonis]MDZ7293296.1 rRNA pseudouridine synthase [Mycoplasmopsis pulmonis]CAC13510.1 RIBOSOMAL LARGE SUBUNIT PSEUDOURIDINE SYNTHASE B (PSEUDOURIDYLATE SYNTHASE) (URACIL HYDROLYASE) [Mycoplasmopsis pulmonis]VEU68101.1 pseudouridylate synthase [Mycoplasmopsis pulmonis]